LKVQKIKNDWSLIPMGITWYFIGPPKTGKTTQASKWSEKGQDGVILLDTELGADFVEGANIIPITSLSPPLRNKMIDGKKATQQKNGRKVLVMEVIPPLERGYSHRTGSERGKPMEVYSLVEALQWLKENWDSLPYDTIAIDTIDSVNEWIEEVISKEFGVEEVSAIDYGKGWAIAKKRGATSIVNLQKFLRIRNSNLILVSHSKQTSITDGIVQLSPDLPRGIASKLTAQAEVIGLAYVKKEDKKHYVSFINYDETVMGSRIEPLKGKELLFDYQIVTNEIKSYKKEA
jgi:hypothetical protein